MCIRDRGKGESVWLGWFLCCCLRAVCKLSLLVPACEADRRALLSEADPIAAAIEKNAWDGNWYVRAFCDDGKLLGSSSSSECMIDSIAQSWSVLSGYGDPERSKTALLSAERFLVDAENGVIKLLTPPFTEASITDVGYIASYPPGIRENGAQYTHAAIWLAKAFFQIGRKDPEFAQKGRRRREMLNPVNHSRTRLEAARYKTEPVSYTQLQGILPEDCKIMIVIPCLLNSKKRVDEIVKQLEAAAWANPQTGIFFTILGDLPESESKTRPEDEELIQYARRAVRNLERSFPRREESEKFHVMVRERVYRCV